MTKGLSGAPFAVWAWGLALVVASGALLWIADDLRLARRAPWADALDVLRLLAYWAWLRVAWPAASQARAPLARAVLRALLVAGLVASALL